MDSVVKFIVSYLPFKTQGIPLFQQQKNQLSFDRWREAVWRLTLF